MWDPTQPVPFSLYKRSSRVEKEKKKRNINKRKKKRDVKKQKSVSQLLHCVTPLSSLRDHKYINVKKQNQRIFK